MLRMMCVVTLRDRISSSDVAERVGVDLIEEWLRKQRLRWFVHLLRRDGDKEVGSVLAIEVAREGGVDQQSDGRMWLGMI